MLWETDTAQVVAQLVCWSQGWQFDRHLLLATCWGVLGQDIEPSVTQDAQANVFRINAKSNVRTGQGSGLPLTGLAERRKSWCSDTEWFNEESKGHNHITLTTFLWDGSQKDIKIQAKESRRRQPFYGRKLKWVEEGDIGEWIWFRRERMT